MKSILRYPALITVLVLFLAVLFFWHLSLGITICQRNSWLPS